jgi:hypothetical protein
MVIQQDLTNSNGGFNLIEPRKMVFEKKRSKEMVIETTITMLLNSNHD